MPESMLTPIQIFLLVLVLFAVSRVYLRAKEKILSPKTALFWFAIWTAAAFGILLPTTTSNLAQIVGVGRGVDVIVYVSLALIFYLVFRLFVLVEDLRHEITSLIRQIALQNPSKKTPRLLSSSRRRGSRK